MRTIEHYFEYASRDGIGPRVVAVTTCLPFLAVAFAWSFIRDIRHMIRG